MVAPAANATAPLSGEQVRQMTVEAGRQGPPRTVPHGSQNWRSVGSCFFPRWQGGRVEPQFLQGPNRCEVLVNARWLNQIGRDLVVIGTRNIDFAPAAANDHHWY